MRTWKEWDMKLVHIIPYSRSYFDSSKTPTFLSPLVQTHNRGIPVVLLWSSVWSVFILTDLEPSTVCFSFVHLSTYSPLSGPFLYFVWPETNKFPVYYHGPFKLNFVLILIYFLHVFFLQSNQIFHVHSWTFDFSPYHLRWHKTWSFV